VVLFFVHIPFMVNHTFNAVPTERLKHYNPGLLILWMTCWGFGFKSYDLVR